VIQPEGRVMRAEIQLPPLEVGQHTLHVVIKDGEGDDAQRIAEQRLALQVLAAVQ